MKKLIRQIRSYGSLCNALVCMLAMCQKPEGAFKAPTYILGGSDSSRTRQGGFLFILITKLLSMVGALLEKTIERSHRENKGYLPAQTGIFIHSSLNIYHCLPLLSLPKDPSSP